MNYYAYIFTSVILSLLILTVEIISRTTSIKKSLTRKITHVGSCLLVAGLSLIVGYKLFMLLGIAFALGMAIFRYKFPLKSLSDRAEQSYGEIFLPLGIALSALISTNVEHFVCAVLIIGLADTAAYYFGKSLQSPKLLGKKTVAGSIACLLVSLIISLFITSVPRSLLIGSLLAICELISPYGSDNFILPTVASIAFVALT